MNNLLAVIPASDYGSKTAAEWALLALDGKSYKQLPMSPQSGLDLKRGQIQAEVTVLSKAAPGQAIVCYFGHGLEDCWAVYSDNGGGPPLTFQRRILEKNDAQIFAGVVVTSIACFTGKILGQEIAAKGGVFVGFTSLIAWYPPIEQTGTALRNCFAEVVESVIRLGNAVTRRDLEAVFRAHLEYWKNQSDHGGDGADNAGLAYSFLSSALDCMVVW